MIAGPQSTYPTYTGLRAISGLATSLWTNVISFVVLYVVWNLRVFDINRYFHILFAVVLVPSICIGLSIPLLLSDSTSLFIASEVYTYFRLLCIAFNITLYIVVTLKLRYRKNRRRELLGSIGIDDPIEVLTNRMKYYPIVQIITRGGSALSSPSSPMKKINCLFFFSLAGSLWYESQYGYGYSYFLENSTNYHIAVMVYAICLPIAGKMSSCDVY
jgi:hypothetical protein